MMWIEYEDLLDAMESAISCVAKNAGQMEHAICKGFCSLQERKLWVELKIYLDEVLHTWKCAVDLQLRPQNIARKRTTFLNMDPWTPEEVREIAQTWLRFRNKYQEVLLYLTLPTTIGPHSSDIRNLFLSTNNSSPLDAIGELRWCGYGDLQDQERANWHLKKLTLFNGGSMCSLADTSLKWFDPYSGEKFQELHRPLLEKTLSPPQLMPILARVPTVLRIPDHHTTT
jgi:hypothetical protein